MVARFDQWGLLLIDLQKDLVQTDGVLPVAGAERLSTAWAELVSTARRGNAAIVASAQSHIVTEDQPMATQGLPIHCVAGTTGAEYVAGVEIQGSGWNLAEVNTIAAKLQGELPAEVLLQKPSAEIWDNPVVQLLLEKFRDQGVQAWVIAGLPTEEAVKQAVLGLRAQAWPTYIVTDAIAGRTDTKASEALRECEQAGAMMIERATALLHWKKNAIGASTSRTRVDTIS